MRLFCALHADPVAAQSLIAAVEALESLPDHRLTPLPQVHMTLLFIGDVDARDLDEVKESVLRAATAVKQRAQEKHINACTPSPSKEAV